MYPSFLFCPLLGITLTCAPALLSKRTLTKRVEDDDSTVKKQKINCYVFVGDASRWIPSMTTRLPLAVPSNECRSDEGLALETSAFESLYGG